MLHLLGLTSVLLVFHIEHTDAVCGNTPVVWRNDNMTCPDRAICGDVFETVRDWYNGTRCQETRMLSNCLCPGGTVCPTTDDANRLYSSRAHKQYVCRPTCRIPWCNNVQLRPIRGPGGTRPNPPVSITAVQNAVEFGGKTYYKMSCRCVRHHYPISPRGRGRSRSVKAYRYEYNWTLRTYSTIYVCDNRGSETFREDPCDSD